MNILVLIFCFIPGQISSSPITHASVSSTTFTIRSSTDLKFSLLLNTHLTLSNKLLIIFPQSFPIRSSTLCSLDSGASNPSQTICNLTQNSLYISNCFPSTSLSLMWTIYNYPTPNYSGLTDSFKIFTLQNDDNVIDSITSGLSIEFQAAAFAAGRLTSTGSTGEFNEWQLSLNTNYEVPGIFIKLPYRNQVLNPQEGYLKTFCEGIRCQAISNFELASNCSCADNLVFLPGNSTGGQVIIAIWMRNPPSTDVISGVIVFSASSSGSIESLDLVLQVSTPANMDLEVTIKDNHVAQETEYLFFMNCSNPIPAAGGINLNFVGDFDFDSATVIGFFNIDTYPMINRKIGGLSLINAFTGYVVENDRIVFALIGVVNPGTVRNVGIKAWIVSETGGNICFGEGLMNFIPAKLEVIILPYNSVINVETYYTFTITSGLITADSAINITFPQQIQLNHANCSADCAINYPSILLSKLQISGTSSVITIHGVINPNSTLIPDAFLITLFEDHTFSAIVAESTQISITPSPGLISASLSKTSDKAGQLSTYTISILLTTQLPPSGSIEISFPPESLLTGSSTCTGLPQPISFRILSNNITIFNYFLLPFTRNLTLSITNVINPQSICASSPLKIQTRFNSSIIDELISKITITATIPGDLIITLTSSSNTVGEVALYSFSIISLNYIQQSFLVSFPAEFRVPNAVCVGNSIVMKSVSCRNVGGNQLAVSLELGSAELKKIEFGVDGVVNPRRVLEGSRIEIASLNAGCLVDIGNVSTSITQPGRLEVNFSLSDYRVGHLSNYTFKVSYSNPLSSNGSLNILISEPLQITPATYCDQCNISDTQITSFPSSTLIIYNILNSNSSLTSANIKLFTSISSNLVDSYTSFPIFFSCDTNCLSCSSSSTICTACPTDYIMYQNTCITSCPLGFGLINNTCVECDSKCKSCEISYDYCSSCLEGYAFNGICVDDCPKNTTVVYKDVECISCLEGCLTCEGSIENCTSCGNEKVMYNNQCLQECPGGLVVINGNCEACTCTLEQLNNNICDPDCNNLQCGFDNNSCVSYLSVKSMPSLTAAGGSAVLTATNKFVGKGEILGSTLALWGLTQSCSWVSFAYSLSETNKNRRLTELNSSNSMMIIIISVIAGKILTNLVFVGFYICKFVARDHVHLEWARRHKIWISSVCILAGLFSFQLIRVFFVGPNQTLCCKAPYSQGRTMLLLLMIYSVVCLLFAISPVIAVLVYCLYLYPENSKIYAQVIDSLVLSIAYTVVTVFDIIQISIEFGRASGNDSQTSVAPLKIIETRVAEETVENKFEESEHTTRKLELDEIDQIEPELENNQFDSPAAIGEIIEDSEEFVYVSKDHYYPELFIVIHRRSSYEILLKSNNPAEFTHWLTPDFSGCKVLDVKPPANPWEIGRLVNESEIRIISVSEINKFMLNALLLKNSLEIVIYKDFTGSILSDASTGTALSTVLPQDFMQEVVVDPEDFSYGLVRIENISYRVFRDFNNSVITDVFVKPTRNFDISFTDNFEIREQSLREILESKDLELSSDEITQIQLKRLKNKKLTPIQTNPFSLNTKE